MWSGRGRELLVFCCILILIGGERERERGKWSDLTCLFGARVHCWTRFFIYPRLSFTVHTPSGRSSQLSLLLARHIEPSLLESGRLFFIFTLTLSGVVTHRSLVSLQIILITCSKERKKREYQVSHSCSPAHRQSTIIKNNIQHPLIVKCPTSDRVIVWMCLCVHLVTWKLFNSPQETERQWKIEKPLDISDRFSEQELGAPGDTRETKKKKKKKQWKREKNDTDTCTLITSARESVCVCASVSTYVYL